MSRMPGMVMRMAISAPTEPSRAGEIDDVIVCTPSKG